MRIDDLSLSAGHVGYVCIIYTNSSSVEIYCILGMVVGCLDNTLLLPIWAHALEDDKRLLSLSCALEKICLVDCTRNYFTCSCGKLSVSDLDTPTLVAERALLPV